MTQAELIARLAEKTGEPKAKVEKMLKSLGVIVKGELKNDGSVKLPELGTFKVQQRAARAGRNPRTGKTIQIAACKVAKFQPSKSLADDLK
ncbi:HU family DNA-binding protein [Desulfovibrio sp. OttesenSCG-928-M14]|nr:HU family DNA-binding protein [Desulfovibrio sp. OttesenSCG-928-M14]MDL2291265.1 HU family DNA-binding protein [Desulfovibrio sp. OttesenSCG-928-F20]